jgi:hypothetical protein
MNKLTLGRAVGSDIQITDPSVSSAHAFVSLRTDNELDIEDRSSTNGTYKNGVPVSTCRIGPRDSVAFGRYVMQGVELIDKVRKKTKGETLDYTDEFRQIERLFRQYETEEKRIDGQRVQNRVFVTMATAIIVIPVFFILPDNYRVMVSVLFTIGGLLFTQLIPDKSQQKKSLLKLDYNRKLVCPKCKTALISGTIEYWRRRRSCASCNAIWVK